MYHERTTNDSYTVKTDKCYSVWPQLWSIQIVNQARFFTNFDYKMSTTILYVRIKYSMYDLICDVISCCV